MINGVDVESGWGAPLKDARKYYDDFSRTYDIPRSHGYHAFIDDLETECIRRWLPGPRVLEVGCGTGQILDRVRSFAPTAIGIDLSKGMLGYAHSRGLRVGQATATRLPFPDRSFDLVYSFKVLPHIPDLDAALREMVRVLDDGGVALMEFYNTHSLRVLWKKLRWWNVRIGQASHDRQVYTSYQSPSDARGSVPAPGRVVGHCGIVIVTPHPVVHRVPIVGPALRGLERMLSAGPFGRFGGFYIVAARKEDALAPSSRPRA